MCALDSDKAAPMNWVSDGVCRLIGNGEKTRFWKDVWFGDRSLKEAFPRLYSLSTDKPATIDRFGYWEGNVWRWRWMWRRGLFAWEEDLLNLFSDTMLGAYIRREVEDVWVWKIGDNKVYSNKAN